jgi:hypothetical protein
VVIGANSFLSAQHLAGSVGQIFYLTTTVSNVTTTTPYTTIAEDPIPNTDLVVWQVSGTFPSTSIAPLYSGTPQVGAGLSFVGYGLHTQGTAIVTGSVTNGWYWAGSPAKNYSQNTIYSVANDGVDNSQSLDYLFQPITGQNEGIYASGDSGGGAFIDNAGQYQLAGIAYGVTEYYTRSGSPGNYAYTPLADGNNGGGFDAAIYDGTGLYVETSTSPAVYAAADGAGFQNQYGVASDVVPYENQILAFVPEPGSMALAAASGVLLLGRRRPTRRTRPG